MSTELLIPRFYDPKTDLPIVKEWWSTQEPSVDPELFLPEDGIIIPDVCAAWLYLTSNGPLGWIAWPVGNPKASARDIYEGLELVFLELKDYAKSVGVKAVTANIDTTGLVKVFERAGFKANNKKSTSLWARV